MHAHYHSQYLRPLPTQLQKVIRPKPDQPDRLLTALILCATLCYNYVNIISYSPRFRFESIVFEITSSR